MQGLAQCRMLQVGLMRIINSGCAGRRPSRHGGHAGLSALRNATGWSHAISHWRLCRKEAIEAGAVPALCSVLGTGDDEPVSIEVLKALYTIISPDGSGGTCRSSLVLPLSALQLCSICD